MTAVTLKLGPDAFCAALGLAEGDMLILVMEDGGLRLSTPARVIARAQALVQTQLPADRPLSAEALSERRMGRNRE